MPLPAQIQLSNTFGQWINTTNQIITATGNSSEYILVAQNATPQTSTGNVSVNGTITVVNLTSNGVITGNGVSLTSLNASALATGTIPLARLSSANTIANGVVDTTTQSFAGDKTFTGVFVANAGSKLVIQNGTDGTSTRGIFLWTESDSNWGLYLSQAGASKSLANGTAASSIDSRSGWHVRSRSGSLNSEGFLWENQNETTLMNLTGDTGDLYLKGNVYIGNSTSQVAIHTGSTTGINASALSTGTVPVARLSSANTTSNGVVDTTTQSFAGNKTFTNNVEILGYLTVGNNTITLNSTTLVLGNSLSNLVFTTAGITKDGTTIVDSSGVANNATNLNGQPASYYTNASNLNSGIVPLARLSSANTVANGVVDTTTQSFAGDKTFTNNVAVSGTITGNVTGNVTGTSSNATNLNSQPASYYTNASNLATGTVPLDRLDANVILTTSTTGMNAAALSTGTVPLDRLTSANTTANGVVDTTTQSFAGNKTFNNDVTVTGNLNVLGTTTTVSANNLIVDDSLIQLAANNLTSDALDIGLFGNYNGDGGAHEHTGLFRDATDGTWRLFIGLQDAPTTTVNTAGTGYAVGTLISYLTSGILTTNTTQLKITSNSSYAANLTINTLSVSGAVNALSTFDVVGIATFGANANFDSGTLFVDGTNNRVGVGNTSPTHAFRVQGTTSINGAFTTDTTASLGGAVNALSTLGVTGAATLANTLAVTGTTTLSNTLTVTGTSTMNGTIDANNKVTLNTTNGRFVLPVGVDKWAT